MGREAELGSLEIGKLADVIAIDLSDPLSQPVHNPISQVVYSTSGEQVSHVWIHGQQKLADRHFTDIDVPRIIAKANEWQQRIQT
jgi:5-methylthioadenosine/S-adenosylhomocysteine deaminase